MAITSVKTGSSFTNLQKYNQFLGPNSAYIPSSFESIATINGTGSSGTITFSSIPSTYKSLQVRILHLNTSGDVIYMRLNGDTGANYVRHNLTGYNSSVYAQGGVSQTQANLDGGFTGGNATYPEVGIVDIIDYANTSKYKTIRAFMGVDFNGTSTGTISLTSNLWLNTSAVNSLTLFSPSGGNFATNATFALYGIKG